jgi:transcriptional regulator with XRE-family HTH domain
VPKRSQAETAFRRDIAAKLRDYIQRNVKSQAQAARELGISRQRLQKYLQREMTPRSDFLCDVAQKWNLEFIYRGRPFAAGAFKTVPRAKVGSEWQLSLFDKPQVLRNDEWEVRVHRKSPKSLDLSIEIRLVS